MQNIFKNKKQENKNKVFSVSSVISVVNLL
jgi:hypothetical protein